MKLHAVVADLATARRAAAGGATVVQLRLKGLATADVVARGRPFAELCRRETVTFVVNDDVEAAVTLEADGVHLGQDDPGSDDAHAAGLLLGRSAATPEEAERAEQDGAHYVGAGPVWATPTKADAVAPIGLDGLVAICRAVTVPVVAIGGIDTANAGDCIAAGAGGVAVVRAAAEATAILEAVDAALAAR